MVSGSSQDGQLCGILSHPICSAFAPRKRDRRASSHQRSFQRFGTWADSRFLYVECQSGGRRGGGRRFRDQDVSAFGPHFCLHLVGLFFHV